MRILHVVGKLDRGGAETWLVQVLRHIDRQKYQMDFLVHTSDAGAYDQEVRSLGARIIPCLSYTNPLRYARNFLRILRQFGPYDVVHSHVHHFSGYVLMLAAMGRVPTRIAHSHTAQTRQELAKSFKRRAYSTTLRGLIARFSSGGIAVSENSADGLFPETWRTDHKWTVSHTGIDLTPFQTDIDRRDIREELGISPFSLVVGHVGRFCAAKNHAFLVEIAKEFTKLENRAVFLLVGDGELRGSIEAQVRFSSLASSFRFLGLRTDVARVMIGAMDIFLMPSRFEGVPLALLEAQAANLPCLVSDQITSECDLVPTLVERETLTATPLQWAEHVWRLSRNLPARSAVNVVDPGLRRRSIHRSIDSLAQIYSQ
jgi:glycosyltransferase involved in cell wall biosynthesis